MPSILDLTQNSQVPTETQDPMAALNSLVGQIMNSADPKQTFNQVVSNIDGGQNALNLIQQYGNGDPKAAFMNYAAQQGKSAMAQQIMQTMGLQK